MRYYSITITNPQSGNVVTPPGFEGLLGGASYTSFVNGQTLPGAWNVELDIPVIDAATSQGFASARVWGISQQEIAQANNLQGFGITIAGGMQKGLPLANPSQAGQLTAGTIFQCFGNWIGTDMTLDFVISPGPPATSSNTAGGIGTLANPKNIVLNWPKGQAFGTAIQNALSTAFPGATLSVNVASNIVRQNDEFGFYPTLEQFAQFCRETSLDVIKTSGYTGVSIVPQGNAISVFDNMASSSSGSSSPTAIAFQDLIGQPTWIEAPTISVKTVMRADLKVGSQITLPPTQVTNTAQPGNALVNQSAAFQGTFTVTSLRHVGNYRAPSGDAWVTVIEAAPNNLSTS